MVGVHVILKNKKQPIDPFQIFSTAVSFHLTAKMLGKQPAPRIFVWPVAMNELFALELYLKALHRLRRRHTRGHDNQKLFNHLSKADKKRIAELFNEAVVNAPNYQEHNKDEILIDIDSVLLRSRDAFQKLRYWYEGVLPQQDARGQASTIGVHLLCDAMLRMFLRIRPEWSTISSGEDTLYLLGYGPT